MRAFQALAMSSDEMLSMSLYALAESGQLEALQRAAPADFDWTTLGHHHTPPLVHVACAALGAKMSVGRAILLMKWMVRQGADPAQRASPHADYNYFIVAADDNEEESKIEINVAGHSAISVLVQFRDAMLRHPKAEEFWPVPDDDDDADDDSDEDLPCGPHTVECLINALVEAPLNNSKRDVQTVDASVISMWEDVLADEACQDLTFECEGGSAVGAHALVLSCASPVLRAMVSSRMREGNERKIEVGDSSEAAVKLFLELVYTGGTSVDSLTAADTLAALDLAHRWQVVGVVGMLERAIVPLIDPATFSVIAEAAVLKSLPLLSSSCVKYAQRERAIIDELAGKGELSPAVLSLVGKRMSASGEPAAKKPRRSL